MRYMILIMSKLNVDKSFRTATANDVIRSRRIVATIVLVLLVLFSYCSCPGHSDGLRPAADSSVQSGKTLIYHGAWFAVRYPSDFHAWPGQPALPGGTASDSAFFTSPDRSVQFYVYSPQWNGTPEYASPYVGETQLASFVKTTKYSGPLQPQGLPAGATVSRGDIIRVSWTTVQNKKQGYCRSWENWQNTTLNISFTFGIRYRNSRSLTRYRPEYLAFRSSLEQFGD
jgi:hypothetical protein